MDTALEPLPPFPVAAVGTMRELADNAQALIDFHRIPASMIYFYAVDGGYCVTVHCQDVRAMCAALGVPLRWQLCNNGNTRYVRAIVEGIEFSGSEENS